MFSSSPRKLHPRPLASRHWSWQVDPVDQVAPGDMEMLKNHHTTTIKLGDMVVLWWLKLVVKTGKYNEIYGNLRNQLVI